MTDIIRLLSREDYKEYIPLIKEFRPTELTESEFINFIDTLPPNMKIHVILHDMHIVGTITVIYEPKLIFNRCIYAHIEDVCVLKAYQCNGYGSKLLKHVIDEARETGCMKATLVCNEGILPFYLRNNFEKRGIQCSMLLM
jgi:GNAT superfamily N-acetyltransferase